MPASKLIALAERPTRWVWDGFLTRGRLTPEQWESFCRHVDETYRDADLLVFDTLANLWPVRDENSATEVVTAVLPLLSLTRDRAVLLVHHLRKSDGQEGTGARGSGALAAAVDILLELRRMKGSPAGDRRRMLSGLGRPPGIPPEWVLEWKEDGGYFGRAPDDDGGRAERVERREKKSEERRDELRAAIRKLLGEADGGMTRKELWEALPEALRVNEVKFKEVLADGVGTDWSREDGKGNQAGRYLPVPE